MALMNCPDCGKPISRQSEQCIHCGCPLTSATLADTGICKKFDKALAKLQKKYQKLVDYARSVYMTIHHSRCISIGKFAMKNASVLKALCKAADELPVAIRLEKYEFLLNLFLRMEREYSTYHYSTAEDIRLFFSYIDLSSLSQNAIDEMSLFVCTTLNKNHSGYETYSYLIYQALLYASETEKKRLIMVLNYSNYTAVMDVCCVKFGLPPLPYSNA